MDGNNDLSLNHQGVSDPAAGGGDAGALDQGVVADPSQGGDDGQGNISLEDLQTQITQLQEQNQQLQDQNRLYRLETQFGRQARDGGAQTGVQAAGFFGERDDEDVPTVGELRQFEKHLLTTFGEQYGGAISELSVAGKTNDYQEVIQNHLPNFLRANPTYITLLSRAPAQLRSQFAYDLGVQDPAYQAKKNRDRLTTDPNQDAQTIARNKAKPNLAPHGKKPPLSEKSRFEAMGYGDDLEKEINRVLMSVSEA